MTDPTPPRFKQGDHANIEGIGVVTILSWPATNDGFTMWEQFNPATGSHTRRTDHVSTLVFSEYEGDGSDTYPSSLAGSVVVTDPTADETVPLTQPAIFTPDAAVTAEASPTDEEIPAEIVHPSDAEVKAEGLAVGVQQGTQ